MDYDSNPIMATFTAGSTSAMVNVPVTMDSIVERGETFDLDSPSLHHYKAKLYQELLLQLLPILLMILVRKFC